MKIILEIKEMRGKMRKMDGIFWERGGGNDMWRAIGDGGGEGEEGREGEEGEER